MNRFTRARDDGAAAGEGGSGMDALSAKMKQQPFTIEFNTIAQFKAAREWVQANGGAKAVVLSALRADGFVGPEGGGGSGGGGDTLTLGVEPFNVFARLADGAMPNPVDQSPLGAHAEEFVVCHNRPENDADWEDLDKAATASMAGPDPAELGGLPGHVFITCKDLRWERFNVLVMGMSEEDTEDAARAFLQRLEAAGRTYASARGWDLASVGMSFHAYPMNTVNSLHMHVVNLARKGPALAHHSHKNMPLADVLNAFLPQ